MTHGAGPYGADRGDTQMRGDRWAWAPVEGTAVTRRAGPVGKGREDTAGWAPAEGPEVTDGSAPLRRVRG